MGCSVNRPTAFIEFPQLREGDLAVDHGVTVQTPTEVIADFNGNCRFVDETPDIGAVELQP